MPITIYHQPRALNAVRSRLAAVSGPGSGRLANRVREVLLKGNAEDRLRGVGADGRPLIPWRVRRGRYARATGPTLVPFTSGSRAISGYFARVFNRGRGWEVRTGITAPHSEIFVYHALGKAGTGRKGQVTGIRRNILGITPATRTRVFGEIRRFHRDPAGYR